MRRSGITSRATRTGAATTGASLSIRRTGSSTPFSGIRSRSAKLGLARLQQYTTAFGYGNQDVSGHPGKNNGTRGAWHVSSLRISPLEQLDFLRRLARRQLPVKPQAYDMAEILFDAGVDADGWKIHGKTGTGSPGSFGDYDREHAYGWYVGWARKNGRELVFARLIQDEAARPNAGMRAREQLLAGLPGWLGAAGQR